MKIALLTTSRADYGLLEKLAIRIHDDPDCKLQLIVSGSHVSPEFGLTIKQIKLPHAARLDILLSSDTREGVAKSIGLGCISFADTLSNLNPDWLVVLGDRFEAFSAVATAYALGIPVAHISGGEVTTGSLDDGWRHCITKLSHLHFVYAEEYRKRVIQLGEHPDRVFNVGHIGLEGIERIRECGDYYLVIWHPETTKDVIWQNADIVALFSFLRTLKNRLLFCFSNGDSGSRGINNRIKEFCRDFKGTWIDDWPRDDFLDVLSCARAIIGNSSSGIYEAPILGVPTINIGTRQSGRICADSIINCGMNLEELAGAVKTIDSAEFKADMQNMKLPYMGGDVSRKILNVLKKAKKPEGGKGFYDV